MNGEMVEDWRWRGGAKGGCCGKEAIYTCIIRRETYYNQEKKILKQKYEK